MSFISDAQYYVPVKMCRTAGSIHLFKFVAKLIPEHVKLKRNILWDFIEIDWKEVNMTLNQEPLAFSYYFFTYYTKARHDLVSIGN